MTVISVGILASADLSFPLTSPQVAAVQEPNTFDNDTPPNIGDGRRSLIPDNLSSRT